MIFNEKYGDDIFLENALRHKAARRPQPEASDPGGALTISFDGFGGEVEIKEIQIWNLNADSEKLIP